MLSSIENSQLNGSRYIYATPLLVNFVPVGVRSEGRRWEVPRLTASERAVLASSGDPGAGSQGIDLASIDISVMKDFLERMLTKQLAAAIEALARGPKK
jgi:hypothetical protein